MNKSIALLLLTLCLSACGGDDTSTVSMPDGKGGTAKVSAKGDDAKSEVTMTGADGKTVTMSSDAKSAKFTAYAPQYPGSSVTAATSMTADGKTMKTVTMTSSDKVDDIIAFYKDSVTKAGMPISMSGNFDGKGTLAAGTGDNSPSVVVSAEPKDTGAEISLILTGTE